MTIQKGSARLIADLNSAKDGKTVVGRFDFSESATLPQDGERVTVYDAEGNRCDGVIVERINDDHFRIRVDWSSWVDGEEGGAPSFSADRDLLVALRVQLTRIQQEDTGKLSDTASDPATEWIPY